MLRESVSGLAKDRDRRHRGDGRAACGISLAAPTAATWRRSPARPHAEGGLHGNAVERVHRGRVGQRLPRGEVRIQRPRPRPAGRTAAAQTR